MADSTYTQSILLSGDMVASINGQPTNQGNPGDANFGMVMDGVQALGSADTIYRLTWWQNTNTTDTQFGNGQFWRLEVYNPAADPDGDPATGNEGWSTVPGYDSLNPKYDIVSGLGAGDDYIVFQSNTGYVLYDLNGGLPETATTLTYLAADENGDTATGDNDGQLDFGDSYAAYSAVCFCAGTLIETDTGPRPIEMLRPGDLVMTADRGLQPLRWIGRRMVKKSQRRTAPGLRPVCIRADALGPGQPASDLWVSPQHRLLVRSTIALRMFGQREVLVAAKHLCALPGISVTDPDGPVIYFHLLFERHEVVFANGAAAESLLTGPQALRTLTIEARQELLTLFPELREGRHTGLAARRIAMGAKARRMGARHAANGKPLYNREAALAPPFPPAQDGAWQTSLSFGN